MSDMVSSGAMDGDCRVTSIEVGCGELDCA